jgi:hypothetical protein
MGRGTSVSQKNTASATKTGSRAMKNAHKYSNRESETGKPCQNGKDAQSDTVDQMTERKLKNRALGLPVACRITQPPP